MALLCILGCLLALSGSTRFSGQFFLLSVHASLKTNLNNNSNFMGGLGASTWRDNFYMGTQNGSKLEI